MKEGVRVISKAWKLRGVDQLNNFKFSKLNFGPDVF